MEKYLQIARRSRRFGGNFQTNQGLGFVTGATFYLTAEKGLPYTRSIPQFEAPLLRIFTRRRSQQFVLPGNTAASDLALPP
jgi:hypothetical protein